MQNEIFESMLTGGHHNSLGRTEEVVELVLADETRLEELYNCYFSDDAVVRLRTSSAIKRVAKAQPLWIMGYMDRLQDKIAQIDQASTQWTLANLFLMLDQRLSQAQRTRAEEILKQNLANHTDWIVLNTTMETLTEWAKGDQALKEWLLPHLERLTGDSRKSVSGRAKKYQAILVTI